MCFPVLFVYVVFEQEEVICQSLWKFVIINIQTQIQLLGENLEMEGTHLPRPPQPDAMFLKQFKPVLWSVDELAILYPFYQY